MFKTGAKLTNAHLFFGGVAMGGGIFAQSIFLQIALLALCGMIYLHGQMTSS